jgi:hypothetical protein
MSNGIVIYRGPSEIDNAPIIAVATGFQYRSSNPKLGHRLIQTWIIREDVSPIRAVVTGDDISVCGNCALRGSTDGRKIVNRMCYVPVYFAPYSIWKCYRSEPTASPQQLRSAFERRGVRLGAYGDPAAVPPDVWRYITATAEFWTGYTHQWRTCDPVFAQWCMASCESVVDQIAAKQLGYRTFRITELDARLNRGDTEIACPASAEMGHRSTCDQCRACGGTSSKANCDVVITIHGMAANRARKTVEHVTVSKPHLQPQS